MKQKAVEAKLQARIRDYNETLARKPANGKPQGYHKPGSRNRHQHS